MGRRNPTQCESCGAAISSLSSSGLCIGCRSRVPSKLIIDRPLAEDKLRKLLVAYKATNSLTQSDLAYQLGVTQPFLSKVLSGKAAISGRTLRRSLQLLAIRSDEVGIPLSDAHRLEPDVLTIADEVIALARALRNAGRPREAGAYFWPTLERLEVAFAAGQADPSLGLLLCEARFTNALVVGDLSSEQDHRRSVQGARQALRISNIYGNEQLRAHVLNLLGNQLRVVGNLDEGRKALQEAIALGTDPQVLVAAHSWMARTAAEQRDEAAFVKSIASAKRIREEHGLSTALVNALSITEIEARGRLQVGQELTELDELVARLDLRPAGIAPQWDVLSTVTKGEVLLGVGDINEAVPTLIVATNLAAELELPHQLQRVQRATRKSKHRDAFELDAYVTERMKQLDPSEGEIPS